MTLLVEKRSFIDASERLVKQVDAYIFDRRGVLLTQAELLDNCS